MSKIVKIYGPPGTGKTTTLLNKIEEYITPVANGGFGFAPEDIAFISFTRKAVNEAKMRVATKFGNEFADRCKNFSTLHSFVTRNGGGSKLKMFAHADYIDLQNVLKAKGLRLDNPFGELATPTEVLAERVDFNFDVYYDKYSLARACRTTLREELEDHWNAKEKCGVPQAAFEVKFAEAVALNAGINEYKDEHKFVDFQDVVDSFIETGHELCREFKVIILDEAQDFNITQWDVVGKLRNKCEIMILAGDDDQAIFHWAGAKAASLNNFAKDDCVIEKLGTSFRLPRSVYDYSQTLVKNITGRFDKEFLPHEDNVVGKCIESYDYRKVIHLLSKASLLKGEVMVICPVNAPLNTIEQELQLYCKLRGIGIPENITYSTVHKQKGGEADTVIFIERFSKLETRTSYLDQPRLRYVACTRARKNLIITRPVEQKNPRTGSSFKMPFSHARASKLTPGIIAQVRLAFVKFASSLLSGIK